MENLLIEYNGKELVFRTDGEEVWLSQKEMAQLFDVTVPTINEHIKGILSDDEIDNSTIRKFRIVAGDGKKRKVNHYSLDMIIAVGYRVNSKTGTKFRKWATSVLSQYIREGFAVDDRRVDEVASRVRAIRTSEQTFAKKMNAIFAMASDYDPRSEEAKLFFATVTNKLHYAIHGHTAAELIVERVDADKPLMGLVSVKGKDVTLADAKVAKNYLTEDELVNMARLAEQFLLFAELAEADGRLYTMRQWIEKLNAYIRMNEKRILQSKGVVSSQKAEAVMRDAYKRYKSG
jgi:hypothetical protein